MRTRAGDRNGGVGASAKGVAEHASAIARLEVQLAALELKEKVVALGLGAALGAAAAVFGLMMLLFVFLTIAAGLATAADTWLAFLITTATLGGLAGILGVLALGRLRRATPPLPEQAIREAKLTTEAIKQ
jgi:Putative Actinobacterial Holin-X, holin superfamily III